jgi:hypothetical protein
VHTEEDTGRAAVVAVAVVAVVAVADVQVSVVNNEDD